MKKRKICFIITSLIHYSRNFLILDELKKRKDVELCIILGGVAILPRYVSRYFNVKEILKKEGHKNIYDIYFNVEGDTHLVKAKTTGMGIIEFASVFNVLKPDLVVVRGDRFEMLSAAVAAANMNITLAHIEGGDISGTIDESIRHAITKLSHYHFTTNEDSKRRVIKMGENIERVFNFGSPDLEVVKKISGKKMSSKKIKLSKFGSGAEFDQKKDFLMVMYHPVTSETETVAENTRNLLKAIHELNMQTLWFWPNFDVGAEKISHELRYFREVTKNHKVRFLRYLPPKEFLSLLIKTKCLIGNSSSGIKECSYLGIPVVNVSSRQNGRLKPENVISCGNKKSEIISTIKKQIKRGNYKPCEIYYKKNTSKKISDVLSSCKLMAQKKFED
jgi:bifunctional UDP-N-acetylglucosamine 2-epimerase / N-acetylmannosamine kinase